MISITICTFNVENLFARYKVFGYKPGDKFKRNVLTPEQLQKEGGFLPGRIAPKGSFQVFDKEQWRSLTAKALKGNTENYPDIACLEEIESLEVLRKFNSDYLGGVYSYMVLIDSHDPRLIDVGILSKYKIVDVKTYIDERYKDGRSDYLFSRDCLEITFDIKGKSLTVFANHLKSKYGEGPQRKRADLRREVQAKKVAELVRERFKGSDFFKKSFVVVGDFNDTPDSEFLKPLIGDLDLENVIDRITDKKERWTHWWDSENVVSQIDYILLSPKLAKDSPGEPYIERRGINAKKKYSYLALPDGKKGEKIDFQFKRFSEATDKIEASDHCPVFFELKL